MGIVDDFLFWIDGVNNKELHDAAKKVVLNKSEITLKKDCSGTRTIFDECVKHANFNMDSNRPANRLCSVEQIGSLTADNAVKVLQDNFITIDKQVDIRVSIKNVQSIALSRSDWFNFSTLYDFGENVYKSYKDKFRYLSERSYFKWCIDGALNEGARNFDIKLWSPSLRWNNGNGSHRFSTAHYIACRDDICYYIKGKLNIYRLNHKWLESLDCYFTTYIFDIHRLSGYVNVLDLFDLRCNYSSSTILDLNHSSLFTNNLLGGKNYDRNTTVLLMLHKDYEISRIAKHWLDSNILRGSVLEFSSMIAELKKIEQDASDNSRYIIKKPATNYSRFPTPPFVNV